MVVSAALVSPASSSTVADLRRGEPGAPTSRRVRIKSRRSLLVVLASATAVALASCTEAPQPSPRPGIDARSYVRDYQSGQGDDHARVGAPAPYSQRMARHTGPDRSRTTLSVDAGTSGFIDAGRDSFSTFALDVDTGSYSVWRSLLALGHRPPPASIRPEEWVNAFHFGDPAPTETDLGVTVDGAPVAGDDAAQLVRMGISAREVSEAERPPVAMTFVVDTSGSMDIRKRLGLVQSSLALLAEHMRDDDTIAVATYEDNAKALLPPTPVRDTETILDAIESLRPGGSTNLASGPPMPNRPSAPADRSVTAQDWGWRLPEPPQPSNVRWRPMKNRVAVIVGAGPGLGAAVARAFGRAGYDIGLIARTAATVGGIGERLQSEGITAGWTTADVADEAQLRAAVERFGQHAGRIDVLHYNAVAFRPTPPGELTAGQLLEDLGVGAAGLLTAVAAARPLMPAGSAVLATGSGTADRPMRSAGSLGVQKAALRNLVAALDKDLRRDGIRAASVTVHGTIAEGTPFAPDLIAEVFVRLAAQAPTAGEDWQPELAYRV